MSAGEHRGQGAQNYRNCSYKWLSAPSDVCCDLNSCLLEEMQVLFSTKLSLPPVIQASRFQCACLCCAQRNDEPTLVSKAVFNGLRSGINVDHDGFKKKLAPGIV